MTEATEHKLDTLLTLLGKSTDQQKETLALLDSLHSDNAAMFNRLAETDIECRANMNEVDTECLPNMNTILDELSATRKDLSSTIGVVNHVVNVLVNKDSDSSPTDGNPPQDSDSSAQDNDSAPKDGNPPQDGSHVTGFRKLSEEEIVAMNKLKALSKQFLYALVDIQADILPKNKTLSETSGAYRSLSIARTKMQEASMWGCRAVARPDNDC